tara:strand:- start:5702 stop:6337 length:636 start_codon:yes stop_codon:yes gene_type:complete
MARRLLEEKKTMSETQLEKATTNTSISSLKPQTLKECFKLSEMIASSTTIPREYKGKPNDVMICIMRGMEIGLSPLQSIHSFSIISGKPVLSAEAIRGLCLAHSECLRLEMESLDDDQCTFITQRRGHEPVTFQYTIQMAKDAGLLSKQNWTSHKRQMLIARASAGICRSQYSDVLLGLAGVYTPEEVQDIEENDFSAPSVDLTQRYKKIG